MAGVLWMMGRGRRCIEEVDGEGESVCICLK